MPDKKSYKKAPTTVYLTQKQLKTLEWIKKKTGVPVAELVRRGIDRELKRHDVPKSMVVGEIAGEEVAVA